MSNPYDPNAGQSGQYPGQGGGYGQGGQGGQGGYGGGGYPANPYGGGAGGGEGEKGTDTLSIVGFVLSLTCCLSIVGAILGFVGLGRTGKGGKKGRWAAVSAIVIGLLGTLAAVGAIVGIVVLAGNVVTVDNAETGDCVNVEGPDTRLELTRVDSCSDSHDAEIIAVGDAGDVQDADLEGTFDPQAVCEQLADAGDFEKVTGYSEPLTLSVIAEDPDNVQDSDSVVCYAERTDGEKLTEAVL